MLVRVKILDYIEIVMKHHTFSCNITSQAQISAHVEIYLYIVTQVKTVNFLSYTGFNGLFGDFFFLINECRTPFSHFGPSFIT